MGSKEFSVYLSIVAYDLHNIKSWRAGQAYFNTLSDLYPEIASEYRGTDHDPFYNDDRIPKFLEDLYQHHFMHEGGDI